MTTSRERARSIATKWFGDSFSISLAELIESEILAAERESRDATYINCAALLEEAASGCDELHADVAASLQEWARMFRYHAKSTPPAPEARETNADPHASLTATVGSLLLEFSVLKQQDEKHACRLCAIETALRGLGGVGER